MTDLTRNRGRQNLLKAKTVHPVRCLLSACLLLLPFSLHAQAPADISGAADHPAVDRFPASGIVGYNTDEDVTHQLVLGSMQRVAGRVTPEYAERLRGDLTEITYEISQAFTGRDVYDYFIEQFEEKGYAPLFNCVGRNCGSSNHWANNVFDNRILYGPERYQYYTAYDTGDAEPSYFSLYIITRGNRRIYAHLEVLDLSEPSNETVGMNPRTMLDRLQQDYSIALPSLFFDDNDRLTEDSDLGPTVAMLNLNSTIRVFIVGHLYRDQPVEILQDRSLLRAQNVVEELTGAGIDPERAEAVGVGPLAPQCNIGDCEERIEVVLRP
ncbi:MAG: DUF4892 domain-containing protein [Pseudohongiellaceae bacterium]